MPIFRGKNFVSAVSDYKDSVRTATRSNINVTGTVSTIDGISLSDKDRVLLLGQSNQSQNGIYTWSSATNKLTRATDADSIFELSAGNKVYVEEGNSFQKTTWTLITSGVITPGITGLVFAKENRIGTSNISGTYGSATKTLQIEVDESGQINAVTEYTIDGLPSQTGNSEKYLTTNGSVASWSTVNTYTQSAADAKFSQVANNLSDLANAYTARTNLGLGTASTMTGPSGTIVGTSDSQTLTNKTLTSPTLASPNITTAITLTGASGNSGQVLTSSGPGAAPIWTTATTGGGLIISDIAYPGNDTAADIAGGQTITLNGSGIVSTPTIYVGGVIAPSVTFISANQITFTTPAKTAGTYDIYVVNPGGATAIMVYGISYSGTPAWSTAAGSLGSPNTQSSFSTTLSATGDTPVTYSIVSGSLPSGLTLNTNTGVISGTTPSLANTTTYNFVVQATDAQNQDTTRSFSLTLVAVTVSGAPTIGTATATGAGTATVTFTAPTNDGNSAITSYTATSTPDNITGTLNQAGSGTINISGLSSNTNYTFTVTATNSIGTSSPSASSNQITTATPAPTVNFLVVAGGGSGGMQGNRAGGGGGAGGLKSSYAVGGGPSGSQLNAITVTLGTQYTVTVGAGGASTPAGQPQHGFQGSSSVFSTITTTGGGGGGAITDYGVTSPASRKNGGSSGGANGYENTPGTPVADEGYTGGTGSTTLSGYAQGTGGGGGGAGAAGANGTGANGVNMVGGTGGVGKAISITGSSVYYAGGGGGAATNFTGGSKTAGAGGAGGGGAGGISDPGTSNFYGSPGTANTGGGGGGASQYPESGSGWPGRSGAGGSGVVILRYPSSNTITIGAGLTGSTITDGSSKVTIITAGTGNVSWS